MSLPFAWITSRVLDLSPDREACPNYTADGPSVHPPRQSPQPLNSSTACARSAGSTSRVLTRYCARHVLAAVALARAALAAS
jgi:hypothetical protein